MKLPKCNLVYSPEMLEKRISELGAEITAS